MLGNKGKRGGVGAYRKRKYYPNTCTICHGVFYSSRNDAKTCSEKCRKAKSRLKKFPSKSDQKARTIQVNRNGKNVGQMELWT